MEAYSIGHSTRSIEVLINMLKSHNITMLVDVRTAPGSRRNPQYNKENLQASIEQAGIRYVYMEGLGGFRKCCADSINTGWRNLSFRGYADYMQTDSFDVNINILLEYISQYRVAYLCAEAVPWRCHRSLISDALLVRNVKVHDIMDVNKASVHKLTGWAHVDGLNITYPGNGEEPLEKIICMGHLNNGKGRQCSRKVTPDKDGYAYCFQHVKQKPVDA